MTSGTSSVAACLALARCQPLPPAVDEPTGVEPAAMPSLIVDRIRKAFGNVPAVRDVSFKITDRSTFGLLGPNGAGKTTTMRMILGILIPDGGTISWNGKPVGPAMRHIFGYLPEERG